MKKFTLLVMAALAACPALRAYESPGNGQAYTLESLSGIAESGVTKNGTVYTMADNVTISEGDSFTVESGATLKMGDGVTFRINGSANFAADSRVLVTRNLETDEPKGLYFDDETAVVEFRNIDVEYAGVRSTSSKGMNVDNCTFRYCNTKLSSSGALSVGSSGAVFKVTNCVFEYNQNPGIGGGANYACGATIENCVFNDNTTKNQNRPQINLTVGGDNPIVIRNCLVQGAQRTKVGGISVSNTLGLSGANEVLIENCTVTGNRYGITTLGAQKTVIRNNNIYDNIYETNAMNGGSGISIYDSNGLQDVVISGNYIADNLWGITIIGGKSVNAGKTDDAAAADYNPGRNVFKNNGNGGVLYDLYNNGTSTVYAQGNQWNVDEQTAEKIETVVTHQADDSSLGEVIYTPALTTETATPGDEYVTAGDGKAYTFEVLSTIPESGVTKVGTTYTMVNSVTISEGDSFTADGGATVKMGDGVQMTIKGTADFASTPRILITRLSEEAAPKGIYMQCDTKMTTFRNIDFEYAALRNFSTTGLVVDNCSFRYANGSMSSSGALSLGSSGATFKITNSTFEQNSIPAIGGAANFLCEVLIDGCTFDDNTAANTRGMNPQVNLTVGGDLPIVVRNSTFTGAQRPLVGGLAVANWMGSEGENRVTVENCKISGNAYGLTLYGLMNATVVGNELTDNKYVANAMNGGSGISVYNYYGTPKVTAADNLITDNYWGVTIIGAADVNFGKVEDAAAADYNPGRNVFKNNGNGGVLYDLYNNGASTVYAQGNQWNVDEQTAEKIETVVFHKADDSSLGEVIYMPAWTGGSVDSVASETEAFYSDGKIKADGPAVVEVYTVGGVLAGVYDAADGLADVSALPAGVYVARVTTADGTAVLKIVK